jgi:hypothetical protein
MTSEVPISRHLGLYSYWLSKRNGRLMPARRDMDPAELGRLLPFLCIVDKAAGEFRYRLMGTGMAQDLGRDLTGRRYIAYAGNNTLEVVAAMQALGERVFANAQPVFVTARRATGHGTIHNSSRLLLPLSDDGRHVNMFIAARAACFNGGVRPSKNWLEGARMKLLDVIDIHHASDLEKRCRDWKYFCLADGRP